MRASFARLGALGLAAVGTEGFAPPSSGGIARRQVQQQRRHGHVTMFGGPSHRRGASMLRWGEYMCASVWLCIVTNSGLNGRFRVGAGKLGNRVRPALWQEALCFGTFGLSDSTFKRVLHM